MTAVAQAADPLPAIRGLVFLGFPLHPAGKPGTSRAAPLAAIEIPMLFLQGTRDALAQPDLLAGVVAPLAPRATLVQIPDADHGFHVPRRSGQSDAAVLARALDALADWAALGGTGWSVVSAETNTIVKRH
ncbi:MAG: hypothetical protein J0H99_04965 [Rhodospirillales bacterium]|nr:hypothetical protein [Rhodospirillales bacterium]